jgi:hypothetical protein
MVEEFGEKGVISVRVLKILLANHQVILMVRAKASVAAQWEQHHWSLLLPDVDNVETV